MEEHLDLFTTPLSIYRFDAADDVNDALRDYALARASRERGIRRSNVGSYHSEIDFPSVDLPAVQRLHAFMMRCFDRTHRQAAAQFGGAEAPRPQWLAQGWLMVMGDGHFTDVHSHSEALWSGVYYVDAGDACPPHGQLALVDPRVGVERGWPATLFPNTFALTPESGAMIVFPSWLKHYVYPYFGSRPRISVSYNVSVAPPVR